MNTKNNKIKRQSQQKIESVFIQLLQEKEIHEVSVTDICKKANFNRSTFYSSYLDIYDLLDKINEKMLSDFHNLYADEVNNSYNSNDFLKLFNHIKENQLFYKTYFKLGLDMKFNPLKYDTILAEKHYNNAHISYHMDFFRGGITSIIKKWLENRCDLTPEELFQILKDEYKNKH